MRILDKIKDYYDISIQYGVDNNVLYNREYSLLKLDITNKFKSWINNENTLKLDIFDLSNNGIFNIPQRKWNNNLYYFGIIGYCGELIPYISINNYSYLLKNNIDESDIKKYTLFDSELINKQLYIDCVYKNGYDYYDYQIENIIEKKLIDKRKNQFEYIKNNNELKQLFFKYNTPLFLIEFNNLYSINLHINPKLKYLNFGRFKDSITAYQDIEIFLGNQLIQYNSPKVPVGTDIQLLESKGFDKITSFRKEKQK